MTPQNVLPNRKHVRMREFDYRTPGFYFFTIVMEGRVERLSSVTDSGIDLSLAGRLIEEIWWSSNSKFESISTLDYVIMPDHMHGIVHLHPVGISESKESLFEFLKWFKSYSTVEYGRRVKAENWPEYSRRFWQQDYFERYLRDERELVRYQQYIAENPYRWMEKRRS